VHQRRFQQLIEVNIGGLFLYNARGERLLYTL